MSVTSITERCACGATFDISSDWYPSAGSALTSWRTEHKHEPQPIVLGPEDRAILIADREVTVENMKAFATELRERYPELVDRIVVIGGGLTVEAVLQGESQTVAS